MKILITTVLILITTIGLAQNDLTTELDGVEMTYQYSGGNRYNLKFVDGTISYRFLSGSKPEKWWGPFIYKASKTKNNEYFLSWYEETYGDYVTQILNPKDKTLIGSALIIKKDKNIFHFEKAIISEYKR